MLKLSCHEPLDVSRMCARGSVVQWCSTTRRCWGRLCRDPPTAPPSTFRRFQSAAALWHLLVSAQDAAGYRMMQAERRA